MSDYGMAHAQEEFRWDKEKVKLLSAYQALFEQDIASGKKPRVRPESSSATR